MMQLRTNVHDELYERFDKSKRSANSPRKMFHTVSLTETLTYVHRSLCSSLLIKHKIVHEYISGTAQQIKHTAQQIFLVNARETTADILGRV